MSKLFKIILITIASIIGLVLVTLVGIIIALTGGKDFKVDKSPCDIETVVGDSIYEAFEARDGNTINVEIDSNEMNGILNYIIIDSFNSDYETENHIYEYKKAVAIKKAKISINGSKIKVTARIKYGPLNTNLSAEGKATYDTNDGNLIIKLTKAKLGHVSMNPTKVLKNIDNQYLDDGKIVYPLNLTDKVGDGMGKVLVRECNPVLSVYDGKAVISFGIDKMVEADKVNTKPYTSGDIALHALEGLTPSQSSIRVTKDDFNGYIRDEYDIPKYEVTQDILGYEYSIKTDNDVYFDTVNSKIYIGINLQGIYTHLCLGYTLSLDSDNVIFTITSTSIGEIEFTTELDEAMSQILTNGSYKISKAKLEAALNGLVSITSISVDSATGDFIFGVSVL